MTTMTAVPRSVKPAQSHTDDLRTKAAQQAHEATLVAVSKAIAACQRLAGTGDNGAAREARMLVKMLKVVSDPLFNTLVPLCREGDWVR